MGIDINGENIDIANSLAEERGVKNTEFQTMDAHKLDFDDNTFDLIYSYTVAHIWRDPVQVLRELKRVAKPDARVVTAGTRDYGFIPHYPDCPNYIKVMDSIFAGMEARRAAVIAGTDESKGGWDFFWDFYAGRKCVQWYVDAGFTDLEVSTRVEDWWYPSSEGKDTLFFTGNHFQNEFTQLVMGRAVERGYLDRETADTAVEEMKQWEKNPHAFFFHPLITIVGRA